MIFKLLIDYFFRIALAFGKPFDSKFEVAAQLFGQGEKFHLFRFFGGVCVG